MSASQKLLVKARLCGYFSAVSSDGREIKLYFAPDEFLYTSFKLAYVNDLVTPGGNTFTDWELLCGKYSDPAKQFFNENKYNLPDAKLNYLYALRVIGGRFPEGESVIAADAEYSYYYAGDVVEGKWPEGEAAIATDALYSKAYARDILKDRFPEGEAAIVTDAMHSYYYATDVIKGRFPEAEATIAKNEFVKEIYEEEFNIIL